MSGLLVLRVLLFAGECFLASALLPLLGFALTALVRRAALRHLVWTTVFGVLAVLPFVALVLPARTIVEHVAPPAPLSAMPVVAAPVIAAPPPALFTVENGIVLLAALWLAGLVWQLLRMGLGGIGLMRLRRASVPFPADIEPGCDVCLSLGEAGPSTFGVFRPIVLLPHSAVEWPFARLDAVLRHERAHVARRDAATQMLARLVCAVWWFNPLLWLAHRALRRDAEIAADDAVLASGLTPSLYAAELVRLAAEANGIAPGIAMARPPLTQRVEAVLSDNSSRKGVSRMDIAKTVSFGLAATLLLGVARFDLAVAQDSPAPIVAPPAPSFGDDTASNLERAAQAQNRARARADAEKAKADAEAMRQAGAAMTDAAQARQQAGAAMRDAAKARAQADADKAAAANHAEDARKHMAMAFHLADDVRRQALQRLAEAAPPANGRGESSNSSSSESSNTVNGVTTVRRSHQGDGGDDNDVAAATRQAMKAMADAHIDQKVAKAMADAHVSETIAKALADAHVDAVTAKAIADAHIEQRIAEAMARVQPQIEAATRAAAKLPVPPLPTPLPPPVPPVPAQ